MRKFIVHADTIKIFVHEMDLVKYLGVERAKGKMVEHIYIEEAEINIIKDGEDIIDKKMYFFIWRFKCYCTMIIGKIMYNNLNHFVRQKVSILTQKELGTPHDVD